MKYKQLSKDMLSNGCFVKLRNGKEYIYLEDQGTRYFGKSGIFASVTNRGFRVLCEYNENLRYIERESKNYDVVSIFKDYYQTTPFSELLKAKSDEWTHELDETEQIEMTVDELENKLGLEKGSLRIKGDGK